MNGTSTTSRRSPYAGVGSTLLSGLIVLLIIIILMGSGFQRDSGITACPGTYTVAAGDTLNSIAQRCGVSAAALLAANPQIGNGRLIQPGQLLVIPAPAVLPNTGAPAFDTNNQVLIPDTGGSGVGGGNSAAGNGNAAAQSIYAVQPGDTLGQIAASFNVTVNAIVSLNPQVTDPDLIYPGQQLLIPADP